MMPRNLTIAIPTYRREQVLVETVEALLPLLGTGDELMLVDQSEQHEPATQARLERWRDTGTLHWISGREPSITRAMNLALTKASGDIVLFLDDDIIPDRELLASHRAAHDDDESIIAAGRVIQPWQEGIDFSADPAFHFASLRAQWIDEFMGGNFSLRRDAAIEMGGFDVNFVRTAYRFEAEFAWRWRQRGRRIRYVPGAVIHHLKAAAGGTRTFGRHLTTARPDHAVGAYYFVLRTQHGFRRLADLTRRLVGAIATRHHLTRPWWIPITLIAECRGLLWALRLNRHGPALLRQVTPETGENCSSCSP